MRCCQNLGDLVQQRAIACGQHTIAGGELYWPQGFAALIAEEATSFFDDERWCQEIFWGEPIAQIDIPLKCSLGDVAEIKRGGAKSPGGGNLVDQIPDR